MFILMDIFLLGMNCKVIYFVITAFDSDHKSIAVLQNKILCL